MTVETMTLPREEGDSDSLEDDATKCSHSSLYIERKESVTVETTTLPR